LPAYSALFSYTATATPATYTLSLHDALPISDEQDHRLRVLERDMHSDGGVCRAGAAGDDGHAGSAGQRSIGAGHESRSAFVTASHGRDRWAVIERVEDREEALSRNGEQPVAALFEQAIDEQAGGIAGHAGRLTRCTAGGNRARGCPVCGHGERHRVPNG